MKIAKRGTAPGPCLISSLDLARDGWSVASELQALSQHFHDLSVVPLHDVVAGLEDDRRRRRDRS